MGAGSGAGSGSGVGAGAGVLTGAQATGNKNSIRNTAVNTQSLSFLTCMPFDFESPSGPIIACYRPSVKITLFYKPGRGAISHLLVTLIAFEPVPTMLVTFTVSIPLTNSQVVFSDTELIC